MIPRENSEKFQLPRVRKELRDLLAKIYSGKGRLRNPKRKGKR